MIVNLIGPIASGKTTFAKWFVGKFNEWTHIAIDEVREHTARMLKYHSSSSAIEDYVWHAALPNLLEDTNRYFILESTGVLWRLRELFENLDHDVYTVKLVASTETCKKRALTRPQETRSEPYNIDDTQGIELEEFLHTRAPGNVTIKTDNIDKDQLMRAYEEAARYIRRAQICFDLCREEHIIGNNQLPEGDRT